MNIDPGVRGVPKVNPGWHEKAPPPPHEKEGKHNTPPGVLAAVANALGNFGAEFADTVNAVVGGAQSGGIWGAIAAGVLSVITSTIEGVKNIIS